VQIAAVENGGAVRTGDRVEVGGGGEVRLAPAAFVPAAADKPLAGRSLRSRRGHARQHLGARGGIGDLHLAARQRPEREVDVRVAEAGQHQRARQVDDARRRPGPRGDRRVAAHRGDALAGDGNGGGCGLGRVQRDDLAVAQDQVRRAMCGHRVLLVRDPFRNCTDRAPVYDVVK